jgi:hypothetical protein
VTIRITMLMAMAQWLMHMAFDHCLIATKDAFLDGRTFAIVNSSIIEF